MGTNSKSTCRIKSTRREINRSTLLPNNKIANISGACAARLFGSDKKALPDQARVVVIGGGIIGASVAYHLGKERLGGETILLEKTQLTSGTTWHAAGLIETIGSLSETATQMRQYTRDLYRSLERETGLSTGWKQCGFIELAATRDYLQQFRHIANFNRRHGVRIEEIGPAEVQRRFPLARVDDVLAGFWVPEDGRANPVDATMSLARGATNQGVRIFEGVSVEEVDVSEGLGAGGPRRVRGVRTSQGYVRCDAVVNCTGMWARQFAQQSGIIVPNQAAEHYYLITDNIPEVDPDWPVIEDPSNYTYIRPEAGGLMIGLFEPEAAAWQIDRIPHDASFTTLAPDWERMGPFLEKAMSRVPRSTEVGIKTFFCGPESFTPDLGPVLGEAPEVRNYFVAAGMNSIGILSGGGVGRLMAHWVAHGRPDLDVTGVNIDRLRDFHATPQYRADRVVESLGMVYKCHYPSHAMRTGRNVKRSPLHERLRERGAYFADVSGWEAPAWYAPQGAAPVVDEAARTGWNERENWFPYWASEHHACREKVAMFDMSFMSKFLVQGADAARVLNRLATSDVDQNERITYTQFLNAQGTMEADVTIAKLGPTKFLVVATDTAHRHVEALLQRAIDDDPNARATLTDTTGALAQITLQGPLARGLLQKAAGSAADLSDMAFPFRTARSIALGYAANVVCTRITYVGELGFELFVPTEQAVHVYDLLWETARTEGIALSMAGLKALGSLRMEKAYRDYGHDMDNTDTLLQVGLGFTCDFGKPDGFVGQSHVEAEKRQPTTKRLVQVLVKDPQPLLYHGEPILCNGKIVADIRSSSYGHTLGGAVGLAMVDAAAFYGTAADIPANFSMKKFLAEGSWEVHIGEKKYPIALSLAPMYDPKNEKIKQ